MTSSFVVRASPTDQGQRVDQFLARSVSLNDGPELSRSRLQALIAEGHVRADGHPIKASARLKGTETFEIVVPAPQPVAPQPEALALDIVHQDRDLLVVNKAPGMVVHPGAGHATGTLVNALLHHVTDLQGVGGELRPGIVHRLDKDTSGLLVIAKTDRALRALQTAFKSREVEKTYLALVLGQPPDRGTFDTLHARHPTQRLRFTGRTKTGRRAVTHFEVTKRFAAGARVEINLETGRTHQIRVHFAEAGFPLFSDPLYGPRKAQRPDVIGRQALHAWKLSFVHPVTKKRLRFTAPPPADFARALEALASEHADRD
ncbi:MAG: RluA family pseudouridine synthase [Myxococcaceae bacterium]